MNRFAALLDRLAYEPARQGKLALLEDYLRTTPDPDRGWALAALTAGLDFPHAKAGLVRTLAAARSDPTLFALSYDFVGDLAETVALLWPAPPLPAGGLGLDEVVRGLQETAKPRLPALLEGWLDRLDETGRWALLKLVTGSLRIGVSARLAKTALARLGGQEPQVIEDLWPSQAPPYAALLAWLEGQGPRPEAQDTLRFYPPMLAHALEPDEPLEPGDFMAEWKWDGIRVQLAAATDAGGVRRWRLWSRTGEDIGGSFPELGEALAVDAVIDGELLVHGDGRIRDFNALQQRLNRKAPSARLIREHPVLIRAYDLLVLEGEDLRPLPLARRRLALERLIPTMAGRPIDLSPTIAFDTLEELAAARADPAAAGAGPDAAAVEGLLLKHKESPYLAGRPKGHWYKWKRAPHTVDTVLMYAQRGHGKRSSFYSDFTFGVWQGEPPSLVPVGKAYFGFTDEELGRLDRFVREHTTDRFGPVRAVRHTAEEGLVLEIAYEGLQRSTRHKSGIAMRFPRIARIRWDKPPAEADRLETLERQLVGRAK